MDRGDDWIRDQFIAQITKARRIVDGLIGSEDWSDEFPDLNKQLNRDLAIWHVATSIGLQTVGPETVTIDEGDSGVKLSIAVTEHGDDDGIAGTKTVSEFDAAGEKRSDSVESDRSRHEDIDIDVSKPEEIVVTYDANGDPVHDQMNFSNVTGFKGLKGKVVETRTRGGTGCEQELVSNFQGLKSTRVVRRDPSVDRDAEILASAKAVKNNMFLDMEKQSLRASKSPSRSPRRGKSPRGKKVKSIFHDMEKTDELQPPKSPRKKQRKKKKEKDPGKSNEANVGLGDEFDEMPVSAGGDKMPDES